MNKKLLAGAVAAAVALPGLSQAAFDDQGMEYISAGEGLSGTMRFNILRNDDNEVFVGNLIDENGDGDFDDADDVNDNEVRVAPAVVSGSDEVESTVDSLRIFYTGHLDLGGGLRSTYYWEIRSEDDGDRTDPNHLFVEAYDIGLEGPFGKFEMGRINPTAERLVPGGSLDAALGSSDAAPASDPHSDGLRYETNSINGFEFGVSGRLEDQEGDDDTFDSFSLAAKYTSPFGLEAGVAVEREACYTGGAVDDCNAASGLDDADGWRFGARYGQDNYLLAYEYRSYDNFTGWDTNSRQITAADNNTPDDPFNTLGEYSVHRVAVQVQVDRVTFSANYSLEETEIGGYVSEGVLAAGAATGNATIPQRDFDRTTLGVDASYALGSRSSIIIGYAVKETDVLARGARTMVDVADAGTADEDMEATATAAGDPIVDFEETQWLIRYRVDF